MPCMVTELHLCWLWPIPGPFDCFCSRHYALFAKIRTVHHLASIYAPPLLDQVNKLACRMSWHAIEHVLVQTQTQNLQTNQVLGLVFHDAACIFS